jgi:hypothetical protein
MMGVYDLLVLNVEHNIALKLGKDKASCECIGHGYRNLSNM